MTSNQVDFIPGMQGWCNRKSTSLWISPILETDGKRTAFLQHQLLPLIVSFPTLWSLSHLKIFSTLPLPNWSEAFGTTNHSLPLKFFLTWIPGKYFFAFPSTPLSSLFLISLWAPSSLVILGLIPCLLFSLLTASVPSRSPLVLNAA